MAVESTLARMKLSFSDISSNLLIFPPVRFHSNDVGIQFNSCAG